LGIALWAASGGLAFLIARIIPLARRGGWVAELLAALLAALGCGLGATVVDFGGWRELDWRAGLFAFLGAFAAVGLIRFFREYRRTIVSKSGGPSNP
jgi:urea transporter